MSLREYTDLRIAHANAVEWGARDQEKLIASKLDHMLAKNSLLEEEFHRFYVECASKSGVETADDEMANRIRKHFSGKRFSATVEN